ncbi:protein fuzzy homolog [Corythoichthys intestinalis]|uniref:protein fuzzy homolog n=1 Tax=Corythoichthys intestinalis TaxID=161448 RepID=UPI0025A63A14|nr:protein fuzzy homolog [Corythoichthys intestinalis]XP_061794829.1 protein fuzzy homolog [Nerophis lumbriciformis]
MMSQDASIQLVCLTASSGVPLFTRGASRQLPFSIIGSLNGVHMFGSGQGVVLSSCESKGGGRVVWRVFQDSMMLIAVSTGRSADSSRGERLHLQRLLENIWSCMVMVLGQDELANMRNVERLKKDLRSCFGLIDELLEERRPEFLGNLTHCADCLLPSNPAPLQEALEGFTKAAESEFGCLLIHGRVAAATEMWWRLAPQEIVLLSALIRVLSDSAAVSCDCPVFLPQGSPTVAHRLLRFQLLRGIDVCVLCGPTPSLHDVESSLVGHFWSPLVDTLRDCLAVGERRLPPSVSLRPDVLAFLLINRENHRSVSGVLTPSSIRPKDEPTLPSGPRCWELLKLFYIFCVTRYFKQDGTEAALEDQKEGNTEDFVHGFSHQPLQCYLVTDECKSFALQTPQHQLFLLAPLTAPTFALNSIAKQTLTSITAATGF